MLLTHVPSARSFYVVSVTIRRERRRRKLTAKLGVTCVPFAPKRTL